MEWERKIPILTNPYIIGDIFKMFSFPVALFWLAAEGLLFLEGRSFAAEFAAGSIWVGDTEELAVWLFSFFLLLWIAAVQFFFPNGYEAKFKLDEQGAEFAAVESGEIPRGMRRFLLLVMDLFSGKLGAVGVALLSQSTSGSRVEWSDVRHAVPDPKHHTLVLRNRWRKLMILYCTAQTYRKALSIAQKQIAAARAVRPREAKYEDWLEAAPWMVFVPTFASFALQSPLLDSPLPVWILSFLALGGIFVRHLAARWWGYITLLFLVGTVMGLGINAAEAVIFTNDIEHIHRYELLFNSPLRERFIMSICGIAGFLACAHRDFQRGRI